MFSKTVTLATNSYHYFPSTSQEDSSKDLGIWPVNGQRFITKVNDFFDKRLLQEVNADIKGMECIPNALVGNRNIVRVPY